jgi:hypothetical protein
MQGSRAGGNVVAARAVGEGTMANQRTIIYAVGAVIVIVLVIIFAAN